MLLKPMLATSGAPPVSLAEWVAEPKVDGWRAVVSVTDRGVVVRTRSGRVLSTGVGHLDCLAELGPGVCLDGELAVDAGHPDDFTRIPSALSRRATPPVTFWVFDVLTFAGTSMCSEPYSLRRATLEQLPVDGPAVRVVPSFDGTSAADLFAACDAAGMEGIVLKDSRSLYLPGRRTTSWRKVKCPSWLTEHAPRRQPDHRRSRAAARSRVSVG